MEDRAHKNALKVFVDSAAALGIQIERTVYWIVNEDDLEGGLLRTALEATVRRIPNEGVGVVLRISEKVVMAIAA